MKKLIYIFFLIIFNFSYSQEDCKLYSLLFEYLQSKEMKRNIQNTLCLNFGEKVAFNRKYVKFGRIKYNDRNALQENKYSIKNQNYIQIIEGYCDTVLVNLKTCNNSVFHNCNFKSYDLGKSLGLSFSRIDSNLVYVEIIIYPYTICYIYEFTKKGLKENTIMLTKEMIDIKLKGLTKKLRLKHCNSPYEIYFLNCI